MIGSVSLACLCGWRAKAYAAKTGFPAQLISCIDCCSYCMRTCLILSNLLNEAYMQLKPALNVLPRDSQQPPVSCLKSNIPIPFFRTTDNPFRLFEKLSAGRLSCRVERDLRSRGGRRCRLLLFGVLLLLLLLDCLRPREPIRVMNQSPLCF